MNIEVTVLTVPTADAEFAADRLRIAGAFAVEERQSNELAVELRAVLGGSAAAQRGRLGALPGSWSFRLDQLDSEPLDTWRQFAEPIEIADDLVVRPAWATTVGRSGVTEIAIEPGSTFGLGDHPTTRLSAAAVWRLRSHDAVLDVGSGSGVLAIIALVAGASHAVAIDISEASPAIVIENATRNGVGGRINASTATLDRVDGSFDLVLANILAPTLITMALDLRRLTAPDGTLVISGILADRHQHVLDALHPMQVVRTDTLDGWAAVELRHTTPGD